MGQQLKKFRRTKEVTPTVSNGVAYVAGDAIGGLQTISKAGRSADQAGAIEQLTVIDVDNQKPVIDFIFYASSVTGGVDNEAYTPDKAEIVQSIGKLSVADADYVNVGARAVATVNPSFFYAMEDSQDLFFQMIVRSTPTFTATDNLRLKFILNQD